MLNDPISMRGSAALLTDKSIAFFCSQSCPGDVILKAQDWANARGADDAPVICGFHTPVERDVLRILLRGGAPVIHVLARALDGARLPAALRSAEKAGRALIISPFAATVSQTTARTAGQRNHYILTRAASALFAHATVGGKTEALAAEAIAMGLPVFTLRSPGNANLTAMGAQVV
jgi:hypothetical protein